MAPTATAARCRRAASISVLCVACVAVPAAPSAAQSLQIAAGTSTLFDATGASIDVRTGASQLTVGAGVLGDNVVTGLRLNTRIKGKRVTLGDEQVDFSLPTDFTVATRHVPVRGGGITLPSGALTTWAFAGTTSTNTGVPFFRGGTWGDPVGMVFLDYTPRARWHLTSKNAIGAQPTSIQSIEWHDDEGLTASASAGVGVGRPFSAIKGRILRKRLDAQLSYSTPAEQFRRIDVATPMAGETEREAVSVTVLPFNNWRLSGSRQHLLDSRGTEAQATVHQLSSTANLANFRIGTGLFSTDRDTIQLFGTSLTVARQLCATLDIGVDYFRSRDTRGGAAETASVRVKKDVNPRLSILPIVTTDGKQTSVNVGGQFISNLMVAHIGYQTSYVPFGDKSFVRTLAMDVRLQLGEFLVTTSTYVTPYGALRYTVSGSHIRALPGRAGSGQTRARIGRYAASALVLDDADRPIAGAALQLGDEVGLTDDRGRFTRRLDDRRPLAVRVLADEFLTPGRYEVVEAPAQVTPSETPNAPPIVIRMRRR